MPAQTNSASNLENVSWDLLCSRLSREVHQVVREHASDLPEKIARRLVSIAGVDECAERDPELFGELVAEAVSGGFGQALGRLVGTTVSCVNDARYGIEDEIQGR